MGEFDETQATKKSQGALAITNQQERSKNPHKARQIKQSKLKIQMTQTIEQIIDE